MLEGYDNNDLPEYANITEDDLEQYWELWTRWRATDRRFLPSQLMAEPDRPFAIILELDSIYAIIEKQFFDKKAKQENQEKKLEFD